MKTLFRDPIDILADAAMLEERISLHPACTEACSPFSESIEENLIEVAFAETADYDDIHKAIMNDHLRHCEAA